MDVWTVTYLISSSDPICNVINLPTWAHFIGKAPPIDRWMETSRPPSPNQGERHRSPVVDISAARVVEVQCRYECIASGRKGFTNREGGRSRRKGLNSQLRTIPFLLYFTLLCSSFFHPVLQYTTFTIQPDWKKRKE